MFSLVNEKKYTSNNFARKQFVSGLFKLHTKNLYIVDNGYFLIINSTTVGIVLIKLLHLQKGKLGTTTQFKITLSFF